jgi:hypothetical protein
MGKSHKVKPQFFLASRIRDVCAKIDNEILRKPVAGV